MYCNMQGYYQEAGRAGRDGKPSDCILLYAASDIPRLVRLLRSGRGRSKAKFNKGMELLNKARHRLPCVLRSDLQNMVSSKAFLFPLALSFIGTWVHQVLEMHVLQPLLWRVLG